MNAQANSQSWIGKMIFSVKGRLALVVGILMVLSLTVAWVGLANLSTSNDHLGHMYKSGVLPLSASDGIVRSSMRDFISLGEAVFHENDKAAVNQKLDAIAKSGRAEDALVKQLQGYPATPEITKELDQFIGARNEARKAIENVREALDRGDAGARTMLYTQLLPKLDAADDEMDQLIAMQVADAKAMHAADVEQYQHVRMVTIVALSIGIALALLLAVWVIRAIVNALNRSVAIANAIAGGSLGHDIDTHGKGELGQLLMALRSMDERLCGIVGQVKRGSDEVSVASQQISQGNDDLSQRTQEQASSLEETASSMEEMTATVKQNADNASQANQLAQGAREQAERGGDVATHAVDAMHEIDESSRKIADIVGLIDEIAFQTNLLSLNAAVEAARAGEQGRGFAVVASEVRNLAQRCATAAKDIKALIGASVDKVRNGTELVEKTGETLGQIVDSVKKVTDIVGEIAAASQEQSAGIDQVNKAVMQMDETTQQNAALVEESAAAAKSLEEQANGLSRQTAFFSINEGKAHIADPASAEVGAVLSRASQSAGSAHAAARKSPAPKPGAKPVRAAPAKAARNEDAVWEEF